jgi:hypothetical protein
MKQSQNSRRDTSTAFRLARGQLDETPRLRSDSHEVSSTGRLDYVPTHTRHPRRDASPASRLVRGPFDEARSTRHLDYRQNLRLARPRVGSLDPLYSPTMRQKSEHLMRLSTISYRHGYSCDRRGSNAGVRSHFLPRHPGMGGENLSLFTPYHTLFCHRSPSREDTTKSVPHDLGDSALSARPRPRPRPGLDPASTHHRSAGRKGQRGTGLRVFSPSHPLRHHGVQGWPAIPRAHCYSHLYRDRQNFTSKHPGVPASSYPIKG